MLFIKVRAIPLNRTELLIKSKPEIRGEAAEKYDCPEEKQNPVTIQKWSVR